MTLTALLLLGKVTILREVRMMKKITLTTAIVCMCLLIAIKMDVFNAIFMFFLVGIIPGTQTVIPASLMLIILTTIICLVVLVITYATAGEMIRSLFARQLDRAKTVKHHLPKRRFSEI